jgi:hypothetical protein
MSGGYRDYFCIYCVSAGNAPVYICIFSTSQFKISHPELYLMLTFD